MSAPESLVNKIKLLSCLEKVYINLPNFWGNIQTFNKRRGKKTDILKIRTLFIIIKSEN